MAENLRMPGHGYVLDFVYAVAQAGTCFGGGHYLGRMVSISPHIKAMIDRLIV